MTAKSRRHIGSLPDGDRAVVYIDDSSVSLELDRVHKHPREMFAGRTMPDRLVIEIDRPAVVTMTGLHRVRRSASFAASHEKYKANLTFIGPDEFADGQCVRALTFRPTNEQLSVMYNGHRVTKYLDANTVGLSSFRKDSFEGYRYLVDVVDNDRCEAFIVKIDGLTISGHVLISTAANVQGVVSNEERRIKLHYDNPAPVGVAIKDMLTVCDFISFMVGEVVSPVTVQVVTDDEADHWGKRPTFDIYARWRQPGREIDPQYGRRCLSTPMFDAPTYQNALATWMRRQKEWNQSYALGSASLENQREVSRRRFLDAAAWFESIPTFYEEKRGKVARDVIAAAGLAASQAFLDGGADVTADRAHALLGAVNASSLSTRVSDALKQARLFMGFDALPANLDILAPNLARVRGRFAHGEDAFLSNLGHLVHDATLLFEALAAILTLEALGIKTTPEASDHPLRVALLELQQFGLDANPTVDLQ